VLAVPPLPARDIPLTTTNGSVTAMDDLGLLWIPVGFLLILGIVAALFLTI
jgi:hypothetical protein